MRQRREGSGGAGGRTHVALVAVVGGLVFDAALVADLFALGHQPVPKDLDVLHGLQQAVSAEGASGVSSAVLCF